MKKIIIVAIATALITVARAQNIASLGANDGIIKKECALVWSESEKAIVMEDTLHTDIANMIIKSIPPLSEDSVPFRITLPRGNYILSKSPDLNIPYDYHIYIEDLWTEQNYNLNSSKSYFFRVREDDPGRFVLRIEKPVLRKYASQ